MLIWHLSDTHSYHKQLIVPEGIDIVIFSGDESNYRDQFRNEPEFKDFIQWFGSLNIPHKVFIAGNHSSYIYHNEKDAIDWFNHYGIYYLHNETIIVEDIKIWGSPYTPTFGNWYYMKPRHKTDKIWSQIPDDTDIVVVHGPPKGILDLSYDRSGRLEYCGDTALRKHILHRVKPKFMMFGHIHNTHDIVNAGVMKLSKYPTIFSNGSVVTDGKFGILSSNGNIFDYDTGQLII